MKNITFKLGIFVLLVAFLFCNMAIAFAKTEKDFISIGKMLKARYMHSAILLNDGRIFIAGGRNNNFYGDNELKSTEIFDIKIAKSFSGPNIYYPQINPFLYLLPNRKVLIVTGPNTSFKHKVEVYNPNTNSIDENYEIDIPYTTFSNNQSYAINLKDNEILVIPYAFSFNNGFIYNTENKEVYLPNKIQLEKLKNIFKQSLSHSDQNQYYIGKNNNYMYFSDDNHHITKLSYDLNSYESIENENYIKNTDIYKRYSLIINTLQKILTIGNNYAEIFDIKNKKFENIKIGEKKEYHSIKLFLAQNNNVLIETYHFPDSYEYISVFNIINNEMTNNLYKTPVSFGTMIQDNNNNILYIGGEKVNPVFRSSSDKIYMLK